MLTPEIKKYVEKSVLCWLATSSADNVPNVSPKEAFTYLDDELVVANIASPQTVQNIEENAKVCVSFIDVHIQKGFQVKGTARIISEEEQDFSKYQNALEELTEGKYPYPSVTIISAEDIKRIIAPSYFLFPDITENEIMEQSRKTYWK